MLILIQFVILKNKFQFKVLPRTVFEIFAYFWFYKNLNSFIQSIEETLLYESKTLQCQIMHPILY